MASPLFDALHTKLSRKIFDPVAAAATDGAKVTSALRTDYLNRASRFIQTELIMLDKSYRLVGQWLSGLVKTQSFTFASTGTAVATDYNHHLSCEYVVSSVHHDLLWRDPSNKILLDSSFNIFDKDCYTIFAGKTYGYFAGAILTTGSGVMYYLQTDARASSGDTADIAIDSFWYDPLVDIAASFYFSDKGDVKFEQASVERTKIILQTIGK